MSTYSNYQNAYKKASVNTLDQNKLIIMLYDGAIKNANFAVQYMESGEIEKVHDSLIKTKNIVTELLATLNMDQGGEIAKNLKSRRLLLMTDVDGVLDKDKSLIPEINSEKAKKMIDQGIITGGMIPKINTCLDAVNNGVTGVVIVDGRRNHSILFELFSDEGSGTLIRK